uniref:Prepilin-type N-terminal cleavage/methylation domain-containing protein n=1 Tax=candidate division WOR-3 bacterium TaxID=2052148 RepID=A0A7C3J5C2_UNCW3
MKKKGFTLIELLVSITIFSIIVGAAVTVFINSQNSKQRVDLMTQAQQSARIAVDYMIRDIRAAGYNIDVDESSGTPQRRLVYASPYEIVFNANLLPYQDTPDNPKEPRAMKPAASISERPAHYYPPVQYQTGAETVVYTLDWNNDGIINQDDRDNSPASLTRNPNDYCLVKRVYGLYDSGSNVEYILPPGSPFNWSNHQVVSIVAGPDRYPSQASGIPIFYFWYDDDGDPTTPLKLYGDSDNNGEISSTEAQALSPITDYEILDKIQIITVKVTGVSQTPYKNKYLTSSVSTDVNITRNASIDVFVVKGHVYVDQNKNGDYDSGETGIEGMKVKLSTGEVALTDANGVWTYAVVPGVYTASITPQLFYRPTTPSNFDFTITNSSIDFRAEEDYKKFFGMEETPAANISGIVFEDLNADGFWQKDSEPGVPNIQVAVWNNAVTTYSGPGDSVGIFHLDVNATESLYVWVTPNDSFGPSNVDLNDQLGFTQGSPLLSPLSESAVLGYLNEGDVGYVAFGLLKATGTRPTCRVIVPNGGEIWHTGSSYDIKVYATSNDSGEVIKKLIYYYSVDGGDNWRYIDEQTYPSPSSGDTLYTYYWNIPDTIQGSQICLVKVFCIDEGNWSVYDYSDNYFMIVNESGYTYLFLTNEYVDSLYDDTLYLYAFGGTYYSGVGTSGQYPLPRYLNTVNSRTMGIAGDSIEIFGVTIHKQFKTQLDMYAEWITKKGIPYADSIYPGIWRFVGYGMTDDPDVTTKPKYFDIEVFKTDSFGSKNSRVLLFSTLNATTYDSIKRTGSIVNLEDESSMDIYINHGFSISRADRLYIKVYYSGNFSNTGGPSGSISPKIWMTFGETRGTKLSLPPKK